MNSKNDEKLQVNQDGQEQRCTAPHPIISFLFFVGTLLGTLALVWLVRAFLP
jgi:hypothetical protein